MVGFGIPILFKRWWNIGPKGFKRRLSLHLGWNSATFLEVKASLKPRNMAWMNASQSEKSMLMGCESEFFQGHQKNVTNRCCIVLFKMPRWSWVKYMFLHLRPSSRGDDWKSTRKKTFWSWWRPVAYGSYLRWISQIWLYNWKPSNHMTFSKWLSPTCFPPPTKKTKKNMEE